MSNIKENLIPLPYRLIRIFGNRSSSIGFSSMILGGAFILSLITNYDWFSRSGAFLSAVSVLLARGAFMLESVEHPDQQELLNITKNKFIAFQFEMAAVGTLVWGFGDLLMNRFI